MEKENSEITKTLKKRKCPEEVPVKFKKQKIESNSSHEPRSWLEYELLAEIQNIPHSTAKNIAELFAEGCTIPFISRYRRNLTGYLEAEQLREIKVSYDEICTLKMKSQNVIKTLQKKGDLDDALKEVIANARSLEELEHIYAPYKTGGKGTLAERAKALGLEEPALNLLNNFKDFKPTDYMHDGLNAPGEVIEGIKHIIAHIMATNTDVLEHLRKLRKQTNFSIETKKARQSSKKPETSKATDESKFENYFDYTISLKFIKPHQILAINRGEHLKILSVKIIVPEFVSRSFEEFCAKYWLERNKSSVQRTKLLYEAIADSYARLIQPLITREIRSELRAKAEKASYEVFSKNLKQLLLMKPLKGKTILGIDPGFSNGCKMAIISITGDVLDTAIIYPTKRKSECDSRILKNLLKKYECTLVALGNGTACRETESWLSELIKKDSLELTYTIVNECGASIYSCSPEAKKEFPDLDPNLISAVSIARRLQEPLAELVKVDPKHLGVGMYQHDLPKKQLDEALEEVVTECVSFVGINLNTASHRLLTYVSGLKDKRAQQIIECRNKEGPFKSRKELLKVKGIGAKIFEQCAGFLWVGPTDLSTTNQFYNNPNTCKLDCTYIHPESYKIAQTIAKNLNLDINDIGSENFINKMKSKDINLHELSTKVNAVEETVKLILDTFSKPLNYDIRSEGDREPLFKKGLTNISDLKIGTVLTGRVMNVTHFGCFVDVGVGNDGLIHSSQLNGHDLQVNDGVEVQVINLDVNRKRIGLKAMRKF